MIKNILFLVFSFLAFKGHTCSCVSNHLINDFEKAAFVAKVRVIKVTPDSKNTENHVLTIKIQELFKGDSTTEIVLNSWSNSSCAMMVSENTDWIIYAGKLTNGKVSFGACSRHTPITINYSAQVIANDHWILEKHQQNVKRHIAILQFLKLLETVPKNEYNLHCYGDFKDESLKGYDLPEGSFAVYRIQINADLTINKIKNILPFKNRQLHKKLGTIIKQKLQFKTNNSTITQIENPTELLLLVYYFPQEASEKSFISIWDLL